MSEKFCLKWNDFNSNASRAFSLLRGEDFLQDVTLVGDDHSQVAAHKLVLSACSEYFKNIFKNNSHSHPLLCLEGVTSKEIQNILDYIYNGEVNIFQEDLDRFIVVAQRLKLEGLIANTNTDEKNDFETVSTSNVEEAKFKINPKEEVTSDINSTASPTTVKRVPRKKNAAISGKPASLRETLFYD